MKKGFFLLTLALCLLTAVFAQAEGSWLWESQPDGTAVITGWTGEDAAELTVPETVNGFPVTALGDGSLAGLPGLRTVTLPRRVTAIGRDALGAGVSMRGWNGSYAQSWAADNGHGFTAFGFYTLFPDVADLTGVSPLLSGNELTLDTADAAGLAAGGMIVFSDPEDQTDLKAFTVTGIRAGGSRTVLSVQAREPLSAVESYRLEWNGVTLGDDPSDAVPNGVDVPENGQSETSVNYSAKGRKVTVSYSTKTRVEGYYEYRFNGKNDGFIQVITEETVTQKTEGMTSASEISKDVRDFVKAMNPESGGFNLLHTGIQNPGSVKNFASVGASTNVSISAAAVGTSKYALRTTKVVRINGEDVSIVREMVDRDDHPEMEMSGYIKIDLSSSVGLDLKLGSSLSIGSSGSLALKVQEANQYDSEVKCYDARVEYNYGFGVNGKLGLNTPKNAAAGRAGITFKKIDLPMGPSVNLRSEPLFHLEFRDNPDGGMPSVRKLAVCSVLPADQYIIRFHTGTNQKIADIYGKAGSTVSEPEEKPAANSSTLVFRNWSTDPQENRPFDFSQPLPEIDPAEAAGKEGPNILDLWAVWSSPYRELTIDLNFDGREPTRIYVLPGEYVETKNRPSVPLRSHYRFLGWQASGVDDNGVSSTMEWDFLGSAMPDMDITVTAQWSGYIADYDPIAETEQMLEEDTELQERMNNEFKRRYWGSTMLQALGVHSRYDNWRILNNLAGISGYSGDSPVVVIPETFGGTPVVYVDGSGWDNKASLQALIVPSTCCYITGFSDFPNLQYVYFKQDERVWTGTGNVELRFVGVETIGEFCFRNCTSLKSITFPRYLNSIGKCAFQGSGLTEVHLEGTTCTSIGDSAFEKCADLTSVTLPQTVDILTQLVFGYCWNLTEINLDHVLGYSFGSLACTGLETLDLPAAARLADDFITGCNRLKSIRISFHPNSADVGTASITHLPNLESIELKDCMLTVQDAPLLETYTIEGYDYERKGAGSGYAEFGNLPSLTQLELKNSHIFNLYVEDCANLRTIDLTGTQIYWPEAGNDYQHYGPRQFHLINLPKLTRLLYTNECENWFEVYLSNTGLTELDLSRWYLETLRIYDCPALTSLRLSEQPTAVTTYTPDVTLVNTGLEALALPAGQQKIRLSAARNPNLKSILLPNSLTTLTGGFSNNPALTHVRLPENTEIELSRGAFSGCGCLRELTIPACWTASQLNTEMLNGSGVSCLKLDGNADASNLKTTDTLFVAETQEGSAAWNTLLSKGFMLRPAGAGWRGVRYRYIVPAVSYYQSDTVLTPVFFDHPDIVETGLLRVTPGQSVIIPAAAVASDWMIAGYSADGLPLPDPMTAPDWDVNVTVRCAAAASPGYELAWGGARLTRYQPGSGQTILILPETAGGHNVVEIDPAVFAAGEYTEIWLPSTLLRISGADFAGCTALTKLRGAGKNWAAGEDGLLYRTDDSGVPIGLILCPQKYEGELLLPDTVTTLESMSIKDAAGLTGLSGAGLEIIDSNAVTGASGITSLSFTEALEEIRANNFRGCPLETVTFAGDPVILDAAFTAAGGIRFYGPEGAANLTAWADRNSLKYNLYRLTLVNEGDEVTLELRAGSALADYAPVERDGWTFLGWAEQPVPELPVFLETVPARDVRLEAVWHREDGSAEDPEVETDSLTEAFSTEEREDGTLIITRYRGAASRPVIPREIDGKTVSAIGEYAFAGNAAVNVVVVPDTVSFVGAHAFDTAVSLAQIEFRAAEVELGESALANCGSLRTVMLPAAQKALPKRLFAGCDSLRNIRIPETVAEIGEEAFADCSDLYTLHLPAALRSFSAEAVRGVPLQSLTVSEGSEALAGDGTALWTADGRTLLYVCPTAPEVSIPAAVTDIAPAALRDCSVLREVILPGGLVSIGERAFENAGLRSLSLPESLRTIGDYAFRSCRSLDTVYIPDTVAEIGLDIFGDVNVLILADSEEGVPYQVLYGRYSVLVQSQQIPVTGISFSQTEISLYTRESVQLQPIFAPEGAQEPRLHWYLGERDTFYDTNSVSVDQTGRVTGLHGGTQTVYAETPSGLRASVTFTVSSEALPTNVVTDVTFEPNSWAYSAFFGIRDGVVCLGAQQRGLITTNISQTYHVSSSWFDISCPEYPGLFTVGSGGVASYYVGELPPGLDFVDCTMVITGTGEQSLGFRREYPCRVYRQTVALSSTLSLPTGMSLFVGDSVLVQGYTDGLFDLPFCRDMGYSFSSSNPEVVEVDASGHIRARKPGSAVIRICGSARNNTCAVLVRENEIDLQASLSSERILKGKPEKITASVSDPGVSLVYASDKESVVSVDETGNVTYQSTGSALLTLRAEKDGRILAGRTWRVQTLEPYTGWSELSLVDIPGVGMAETIEVGQSIWLSSFAIGSSSSYYGPDASTITWESSDESILRIDEDGSATALRAGITTVRGTLEFNGQSLDILFCCDCWYAYVRWLSESGMPISVGEEKPLPFSLAPAQEGLRLSYTTSYGRVSVDENGVLTGVNPGDDYVGVTIRNRYGMEIGSGQLRVHVLYYGQCAAIDALPETVELCAGETLTLASAGSLKPDGAVLSTYDTLTVDDETVAALTYADGALTLTALKPGATTARVSLYYGEDYIIPVIVRQPEVYGVLDNAPAILLPGDSLRLTASGVTPAHASVTWASSDASVLRIAADGTVTAVSAGTAEVTMTVADGSTGGTYVQRAQIRVAAALSGFRTDAVMTAQNSYGYFYLELTAASAADDPADLMRRTRFESMRGYEYTLGYGDPCPWDDDDRTIMYLCYKGYPDRYDRVTLITDNGNASLSVSFDLGFEQDGTLSLKQAIRLSVGQTWDPENAISNWTFTLLPVWTAENTDILRPNANSTFTAAAAGETTLTACVRYPDGTVQTASTTVIVSADPITVLRCSYSENETVTLEVGSRTDVSLTYAPVNAALWAEAADPGIASCTVSLSSYYDPEYDEETSGSVRITGLRAGSTTVTVRGTAGEILVIPVTVTPSFSIETNLINYSTMAVGTQTHIRVICIPADPDAEITFTSSSPDVFTVDEAGTLTAAAGGTAYITVRVNDRERYYTLYAVETPRVAGIAPSQMALIPGQSVTLQALDAQGNPISANLLVWYSSDRNVATVSPDGTVTPTGNGTATITVADRSGQTSAAAAVTVTGAVDHELNTFILPAALTAVEEEAFAGNPGLESVTLGAQVTFVGEKAFADCANLVEVIILNDLCGVDPTAFDGCSPNLVIRCTPDSDVWDACIDAGLTVAAR